MAINEELTNFLREGLKHGLPREQLEEILLEAGWPRDQVQSALGEFADITFPIPVPRPKPYLFAREAFVYLVLFSTLYVSAFTLGTLLFQFIDQAFPDPSVDPAFALEERGRSRYSLWRFPSSSLFHGQTSAPFDRIRDVDSPRCGGG